VNSGDGLLGWCDCCVKVEVARPKPCHAKVAKYARAHDAAISSSSADRETGGAHQVARPGRCDLQDILVADIALVEAGLGGTGVLRGARTMDVGDVHHLQSDAEFGSLRIEPFREFCQDVL